MAKDVRFSVRVAQSGADEIDRIAEETGTDRSKVTCEFLGLGVTNAAYRKAVVEGLKRRKGAK